MARRAAASGSLKLLAFIFLSFFAVFTALSMGLSVFFRPLAALFLTLPSFTTLALFAIVLTIMLWQACLEHVPSNTVGLVTYAASGKLKTLAPAGPVWVWIGREQLNSFLSLEPVSVQLPLLGLKSSDGTELAPLVFIITWRVHATIAALLPGPNHQQVMEVATEGRGQRERRVRDRVAEVVTWSATHSPLADLQEHLPNLLYTPYGDALIAEINRTLEPIGLKVEKLECIGAITVPVKATEAIKTIGAVRKKLESVWHVHLDDGAPDAPEPSDADKVLRHARRAVQEMQATVHAVDGYVQAVLTILGQTRQHFTGQASLKQASDAQKEQSERLTALAAEINNLLEAADAVANQQLEVAFAPLSKDELETLLKVLQAIEQKKISLGSIFA